MTLRKGMEMKRIQIYQDEEYKKLGDLYGLFFEDINHAADGGLYAELVQNRSFEYCEIDKPEYHALTAWEKSENTDWQICQEHPLHEENPHYLKVTAEAGSYIKNTGYNTGIYVEEGKKYDFSAFIRMPRTREKKAEEDRPEKLLAAIQNESGQVCAEAVIKLPERYDVWEKCEAVLEAEKTTWEGKLLLIFEEGIYELDMVSLFPQDTFMGRKNGLRRDIAEALKEMKPKFLRFPGGCLTHDGSLHDRDRNSMYRWERTLGAVETRPTWRNNWRYNQTLGLGFYEYFCFCEDIGAKPLPVLPGGFNPHKGEGVPLSEIGVWVQETLDLIEFANGGTDTKWGKIRAELGHEKPFGLEYLGIGNEEIGEGFFERYPYFHRAVREKYPEIKLINTAGPFAVGEGYEAGWSSAQKYGSDMVDEHYYSSPEWFLANMHHYEDYDEHGPKVFLGEYASWGNTYYNAIVEAAYMTHLERSRAVALACYAPMLCNAGYVNWQPDMLWFNNHELLKTPNYYVQKMFMEHQGTDAVRFETEELDEVIPLSDKKNITGAIAIQGNEVSGNIWDIRVTDAGTGNVITAPDVRVERQTAENNLNVFADMDSYAYSCEFSFKREEGRKGLKIFLGRTDEKNYILWEFGGWDNWDCNISSVVNGRGSTISHRIFHVEDIEYRLRLEVEGRRIRTYVNGVLYNDTVDRLPELEELYVTASVERNENRTILKAVNLTGEAKKVELTLHGEERKKAVITELSGCKLDDCNSFEEKDRIVPHTGVAAVEKNKLIYEFKPHSVTVMSFEA